MALPAAYKLVGISGVVYIKGCVQTVLVWRLFARISCRFHQAPKKLGELHVCFLTPNLECLALAVEATEGEEDRQYSSEAQGLYVEMVAFALELTLRWCLFSFYFPFWVVSSIFTSICCHPTTLNLLQTTCHSKGSLQQLVPSFASHILPV